MDPGDRQAVLLATFVDEIDRQRHDVAWPFAQRRNFELDLIQAVVQIGTETLLGHQVFQADVRSDDRAALRRSRLVRTDGLELARLQNAQQFGLLQHPQHVDLVQQNGPLAGRFELAALLAVGTGERASHMPEQLAVDQIARQGAAGDIQETVFAPRRQFVDHPGQRRLASSRFAHHQDREVVLGRPLQIVQQRKQGGGVRAKGVTPAADKAAFRSRASIPHRRVALGRPQSGLQRRNPDRPKQMARQMQIGSLGKLDGIPLVQNCKAVQRRTRKQSRPLAHCRKIGPQVVGRTHRRTQVQQQPPGSVRVDIARQPATRRSRENIAISQLLELFAQTGGQCVIVGDDPGGGGMSHILPAKKKRRQHGHANRKEQNGTLIYLV